MVQNATAIDRRGLSTPRAGQPQNEVAQDEATLDGIERGSLGMRITGFTLILLGFALPIATLPWLLGAAIHAAGEEGLGGLWSTSGRA